METGDTKFDTAFLAAQRLHQAGRLGEAEQAYRQLLESGDNREPVLQALTELYVHSRRPDRAVETLTQLTYESPDSLGYHTQLARLLQSLGQTEAALQRYQAFLERNPELPTAHFNLALVYKGDFRYREALEAYEKAIALGIDNVQEVYSNIGVIYSAMRRADEARDMYERALDVDPAYEPALFNLAALAEELGDRQRAIELYERLVEINPRHFEALARRAMADKASGPDDPLIARLERAVGEAGDDSLGQESLYFARGKLLDEVGRFREAYDAYRAGNALGKARSPGYDPELTRQAIDGIIESTDAGWIGRHGTDSGASPVFICGMFRSGSTLVERMLGAHPDVTTAGELDFMPWLIARNLSPYPQRLADVSSGLLRQIGDRYAEMCGGLFPDAVNLTDKRPDNFLHLGLISAMFPRARIVYTQRSRPDNCLSLYFQQLGGNLAYATDIGHALHYYDQHRRLMDHWQDALGERIFTVDYDELVAAPEPVLRALLEYLGLAWDERCLEFRQSEGQVKTASAWQVREGLHRSASGRWKNYRGIVPEFDALAGDDDAN